MVAPDHDLTAPRAVPVAVCIPVHGDAEGVVRTLASIQRCRHPRARLQVIVAVDGPDDRLAEAARAAGADRVVVLERNRGSYAARNAALDAIDPGTEAVLFTDADVEVDAGWVDAHLRALEGAPRSGGAIVFELSEPPTPAEVVDASRHLGQEHYVEQLGYAATANLAVRREVIELLRFDDGLRSAGDFEFGRRCVEAGWSIAWTPDAIVRHAARRTPRELLRKMDRVAQGARVQHAAGRPATARRRDRPPLRAVARAHGFEPDRRWMTEAWLLDRACSIAFARRVPSVVLPAIRRRLTGLVPR